MRKKQQSTISIVVPVRNEFELLPLLFLQLARLTDDLSQNGFRTEIIVNDNASRDGSSVLLEEWAKESQNHKVKYFPSMKSFQSSLIHGLRAATGDAVVVAQGDMQDPFELIPEMVRHWQEGKKVVVGAPRTESKSFLYKFSAGSLFQALSWSSRAKVPKFKDFFLLDRAVYSEISSYRAEFQFLRTIISSEYGVDAVLVYDRARRSKGASKFQFSDLYELGMDALLTRSQRFVQFISIGGASLGLVTLLAGTVLVLLYILGVVSAPAGWTTLSVLLLLIIGFGGFMFATVMGFLHRILILLLRPDRDYRATPKASEE